ncbi:MAG: LPS assembly lipoprotein LptE [Steroidobacteraceae bacterium]
MCNKGWWILLSALVLSGCGWQLQTLRPMATALLPVYVDLADSQSLFSRNLLQSLQLAGMQITKDVTGAGSVLKVSKDEHGHQVTSISALNQPQQYQIYYRIEYRFDRHEKIGKPVQDGYPASLIPMQPLAATRTMSYDITLALAKQREQQVIEEELAKQLTQRVLRRLNSLPVAADAKQ